MITEASAGGDTRRALAVRRWSLWSVPGPARSFLLLVDAAAGVLMITLMLSQSVSRTDLIRVGVLAFLAIGYAECARIDRLKRYVLGSDKVYSNQLSVWTFAAVLSVPAGAAAFLVALIYTHVLVQRVRDKSGLPYRTVFVAATVILSVLAASAVLAAAGGHDPLRGGVLAPSPSWRPCS